MELYSHGVTLPPQAPISINCALKFDKKSCKTLNSLLHVIKVCFLFFCLFVVVWGGSVTVFLPLEIDLKP